MSSFFQTMLGTKSGHEVRVSRAFAACFEGSEPFRGAMLRLFHDVCKRRWSGRTADWTCDTETVLPSGDRLDLQIQTARAGSPVFQIESKVSAPLTEDQINRYHRYKDDRHLIALTRAFPETGNRWLNQRGCLALRWQDVHRALRSARAARGSDKFLINAFCEYLEDFGMAHREDITEKDLLQLGRVLRAAGAEKTVYLDAKGAFDTASSCLALLESAYRDAVDRRPPLKRWSLSGPTYYRWRGNDDGHALGFSLRDEGWKNFVSCGLWFPQANVGPVRWMLDAKIRSRIDEGNQRKLSTVLTRGVVDPNKMTTSLIGFCRSVGALKV